STFNTAAGYLLDSGYTFDLISDKQLQNIHVNGHDIESANASYKTILLAETKYLPLETLQKLVQSVKEGATLVVYKDMPRDVPGYGNLAERRAAYRRLLDQIILTGNGAVKKSALGKGFVISGDDLEELMDAAAVRKEDICSSGLRFVRRKYSNGNSKGKYYFISNPTTHAIDDMMTIYAPGASIVRYDPMFGKVGTLTPLMMREARSIYLPLSLLPGESCILQVSYDGADTKGIKPYPEAHPNGAAQPITGSWKLDFLSGGPSLPAAATLESPGSWTDLPGDAVKAFSGTARYTTRFKKPAGKADEWLLDLGKVAESAEVLLNGKKIATLIGPLYQYSIPAALLQADNELQIIVSNDMANRIAYMDKQGIPWKIFYNINMPARLKQNVGPDGLFTAAAWQPKPSGLLGPVTITPLIY
ncbi:MAG: glycoside hydrolase family 2 protein, partial [Bacteroidetes bacterium]|nr:glycoside hydrolase family 2 protein [Bacteroidota bacterium]